MLCILLYWLAYDKAASNWIGRDFIKIYLRLTGECRSRVFETVIGLSDAGAGKGVGLDDVCARLEVLAMNGLNRVGLGQNQHVVVALERQLVVGKALPAKIFLAPFVGRSERTHRAIENQNALGQGVADPTNLFIMIY